MKIAGLTDRLSPVPVRTEVGSRAGATDFGTRLESAIANLESTTAEADATSEGLVTGEVDIHEAMVAMEKADLTLRVAGTVRNKVVEAYQQLLQSAGS